MSNTGSSWLNNAKAFIRLPVSLLRAIFPFHAAAWEAEAGPIRALLNTPSKVRQQQLVQAWQASNQSQLNSTGITSALVASVVASGLTWPDLAEPAWTVKALFISSLVVALASIATATQQAVALSRIASHPDGPTIICKLLRQQGSATSENQIEPSRWQLYVWQIPISLLSTSIYFFVTGLAVMVWDAGKAVQLNTTKGPTKIVAVFMVTLTCVVFSYAASGISLYGGIKQHDENNNIGSDALLPTHENTIRVSEEGRGAVIEKEPANTET